MKRVANELTPMNGRCLLDTNILIAVFSSDASVLDNLGKVNEVFVPSVAVGELCFGARKSTRPAENLALVDELISNSVILGCDTDVARRYGEIKNTLRMKGRPIPENDIWIAAIALQHDLTLITRDVHFSQVEALKMATW